MTTQGRITRVILKNYKSIASCDVPLGPLTILVGPNGAGKSNFIDAMRFCRDALRTPLDQVFAKRNTNLYHLRHRSPANPESLGMRFDFALDGGQQGYYSFEIGPQSPRGYEVRQESCVILDSDGERKHSFKIQAGASYSMLPAVLPAPSANRLFLVNASGLPEYQPVYELLSGMEFYTPDPEMMRNELDTTGSADILDADGENVASVIDRLSHTQETTKARIDQYLHAIVPGLDRVEAEEFRSYKLLNFYLAVAGAPQPYAFLSSAMSDGTLRALALLVALFQNAGSDARVSVIGIEEPEAGLHPAATAVLLDALREASASVQVVATSQSSDLLDNAEIPVDAIRAVHWDSGETRIVPIDSASRSALRDRLYTAGELLRMGSLTPEPAKSGTDAETEVQLFR
ncbi:MAG TPA: AAA family ATPase [Bryobacteraceae bacterium]|jgi:predicted ATPase|nr:AAA family ATPase [Bryobacteraceae bacterium]